jgi:cell division control protein 6
MKGYNPMRFEEVLHRDAEIDKYMGFLSRAIQGHTPDNIFVYGQTGIGKSIVTKMVTSQLEADSSRHNIIIKAIYINCDAIHTDVAILKKINSRIQPESSLKKVANSFESYFAEFCEIMNKFKGIPIIIFDEVDKLNNPDILNIFARVKENDWIDKNLCVIGITNDLKFMDRLDPRTKSALCKFTIVFAPYTSDQLRDILNQRAEMAFKEGGLEEMVVPLCAALAAQEHGDARKAIDLLRVSGEIAEQEGAVTVQETHVRKAKELIELDEVKETIKTLPIQTKLVLASGVHHTLKGENVITTGVLYDTYKALCNEVGLEILSQRRVTDLLGTLDMLGIINTAIIYKGRYGRTKDISLNMPPEVAMRVLLEDEYLALAGKEHYPDKKSSIQSSLEHHAPRLRIHS